MYKNLNKITFLLLAASTVGCGASGKDSGRREGAIVAPAAPVAAPKPVSTAQKAKTVTFEEVLKAVDGEGEVTDTEGAKITSFIKRIRDGFKQTVEGSVSTSLTRLDEIREMVAGAAGSKSKSALRAALNNVMEALEAQREGFAKENKLTEAGASLYAEIAGKKAEALALQKKAILETASRYTRQKLLLNNSKNLRAFFDKVKTTEAREGELLFSAKSRELAENALTNSVMNVDLGEEGVPTVTPMKRYIEAFNNICLSEGFTELTTTYVEEKAPVDPKAKVKEILANADAVAVAERETDVNAIKKALSEVKAVAAENDDTTTLELIGKVDKSKKATEILATFKEVARTNGVAPMLKATGTNTKDIKKMDLVDLIEDFDATYHEYKDVYLAMFDNNKDISKTLNLSDLDVKAEGYKELIEDLTYRSKAVKKLAIFVQAILDAGELENTDAVVEALAAVPVKKGYSSLEKELKASADWDADYPIEKRRIERQTNDFSNLLVAVREWIKKNHPQAYGTGGN